MSLYKCKVLSNSGERHVLKIDGFSQDDVLENLRKNSFAIIDVKKLRGLLWNRKPLRRIFRFKGKELSIFCKQMNSMLKSGITVVRCVGILSQQTENMNLRIVLSEIYKELIVGCTFSETLINHKESFPEIFISMVQAGEISGNIDSVMGRLSNHYGKECKIESKVKSAMVYPAVLSIVATTVVIFLLTTVMPTFVELYESSGVPLPFMTLLMLNISQWLRNTWYVIVLIIILFVVIFSKLDKCEKARYEIDSYKLQIPLYRTLKVKLAASRFARTLSTLVGSGVPLLDGLHTVSNVTGNEYIRRLILNVREDVRKGYALSSSLKNQNVFPPMVYSMIKIGEESGQIEEILDKTADFYDEEVENTIQKLVTMIEPIMIVIMAVIIGFIMLAMITPMFDMVNTVQ